MKKLFMILCLAFAVAACETNPPKKEIVYVDKPFVVSISKEYLVKEEVPAPPIVQEYLEFSWQVQEKVLIDYIVLLLTHISKQQNQQQSIQDQIEDFKKRYPDK